MKSTFSTFSVFVCVLEGLDQPQSLIHWSSHGKIIHGDLPQDAFAVNDKKTSDKNMDMLDQVRAHHVKYPL